jgi:prolyl-tRNA synthetase
VLEAVERTATSLRELRYGQDRVIVEVDTRDLGGGVKNWDWIKKGVPIRIEIGPRDVAKRTVAVSRRDRTHGHKAHLPIAELVEQFPGMLDDIQAGMLARATAFRDSHTKVIESKEEFYAFFTPRDANKPEIHGGFALAYWNGSAQLEAQIKDELKVTIRCIPFENKPVTGRCIFTGEPSAQRAVWAKSY